MNQRNPVITFFYDENHPSYHPAELLAGGLAKGYGLNYIRTPSEKGNEKYFCIQLRAGDGREFFYDASKKSDLERLQVDIDELVDLPKVEIDWSEGLNSD